MVDLAWGPGTFISSQVPVDAYAVGWGPHIENYWPSLIPKLMFKQEESQIAFRAGINLRDNSTPSSYNEERMSYHNIWIPGIGPFSLVVNWAK